MSGQFYTRGGSVRVNSGGVYKWEKSDTKEVHTTSSFDLLYYLPFIVFVVVLTVGAVVAAVLLF